MPFVGIDDAFAEYARKALLVTPRLVEEALRLQAASLRGGEALSLSEALVRVGAITPHQRASAEAKLESQRQAESRLGPYRILRKIGEGGMGTVYLAEEPEGRRRVALKVLGRGNSGEGDFLARFQRESAAALRLDHAHIARAYAAGEEGGHLYYAMEFVEGEGLGDRLRRETRLGVEEALRLAVQVARALEYAHGRGIVHRDIKPHNIMVTPEGAAKILDFGLAKNIESTGEVSLTQTGVTVGTPHYVSPEQARGQKEIDGRADIYSLGATLYHLLTGDTPFHGSSAFDIISKHLTGQLPDPRELREEIPDGVVHILRRMMAKKPEDRYAECGELLADLDLVLEGRSPLSPPLSSELSSVGLPKAVKEVRGTRRVPLAEPLRSSSRLRRWLVPLAAGGAAALLGIVISVALLAGPKRRGAEPPAPTGEGIPSSVKAPSPESSREAEARRWLEGLRDLDRTGEVSPRQIRRRYEDLVKEYGSTAAGREAATRLRFFPREDAVPAPAPPPEGKKPQPEAESKAEAAEPPPPPAAADPWVALDPIEARAASGVSLEKQDDLSLLAPRKGVATDVYTVTGRSDLRGITAFRVEALPDASLPSRGPGLNDNGNFVLSEFRVEAGGRALSFQGASASWEQRGFPSSAALDGDPQTGWGIAPRRGQGYAAVFHLREPVDGGTFVFTLESLSSHFRHVLGRFRISATAAALPAPPPARPAERAPSAGPAWARPSGRGTILQEVWKGIGGGKAVSELTRHPDFPDKPSEVLILTSFEGPRNAGDYYGSRIRGYVHPPVTGEYVFWIASDDNGELWLSVDENPANKARIASVPSWADEPRNWDKFPEQQSAAVRLEAGRRFYIETLHKEDNGGDFIAVGWRLPDGTLERPIPGDRLSPFAPEAGLSKAEPGEDPARSRLPEKSDLVGGGGGWAFEEQKEGGPFLVGFRLTKTSYLKSLQGVWIEGRKPAYGLVHGSPSGEVTEIVAKPGFAVGGLYLRGGDRVRAFKVVFMKIAGFALNPSVRYESDWYVGGPEDSKLLGGDGRLVIGLIGRQGGDVDALGIIQDSRLPLGASIGTLALGLAGHWKFDEKGGDEVRDSSQGVHHGRIRGASARVPGKIGDALEFDGKSGGVAEIPVVARNHFTIAFHIRTKQTASGGSHWYGGAGIVDGECAGSREDFGTAILGSRFAFGVGAPDTTISSRTPINDGEWHHVAVTRENQSGRMRLFVDGRLEAEGIGPSGPRSAPQRLVLGGLQTGLGYFQGVIDDVRIYDRALEADEIQALSAGEGIAAGRAPVPDATRLLEARKKVRETFKADFAKSGPEERQALAGKLLEFAREEADLDARYALLQEARESALQAGDAEIALRAVAGVVEAYEVDGTDEKIAVVAKLESAVRTAEAAAGLADLWLRLADEALAEDDYEGAARLASRAEKPAARTKDPALSAKVKERVREVQDLTREAALLKPHLKTLAETPDDPEANARVGKFMCLSRGEWSRGIPMLLKGPDSELRKAAELESEAPAQAASQAAVGDAWLEAARKQTGPAKARCLDRAEEWYFKAVWGVDDAAYAQLMARFRAATGRTFALNLLRLVDPARDAVAGKWAWKDGSLVCGRINFARIEIPYEPPQEYDFLVEFTRLEYTSPEPGGDVAQILNRSGAAFPWLMGAGTNDYFLLGVTGTEADLHSPNVKRLNALLNGQRYVSMVQVRRDAVKAYLNGKLIVQRKADDKQLATTGSWKLRRGFLLGLGGCNCVAAFHKVEVVEVGGRGRRSR